MAKLPQSLQNIALFFERLPGIGSKTANRLAMYLLRLPEQDLKSIGEQLSQLKSRTKMCKVCMNLTEDNMCHICNDTARDRSTITIVETVLDLLSFETGNIYKGVYHILHGKIDPLNSIGPDDIFIRNLELRIQNLKLKKSFWQLTPIWKEKQRLCIFEINYVKYKKKKD